MAGLLDHLCEQGADEPVGCLACGETLPSARALVTHLVRRHFRGAPFPCPSCGAPVLGIRQLQHHLRRHAGEELHPCATCARPFATASSLRRHARLGRCGTRHDCPRCSRSFGTAVALARHARAHARAVTGVPRSRGGKCAECGTRFAVLAELYAHERSIHDRYRAYACDLCERAFSRPKVLLRHIQREHATSTASRLHHTAPLTPPPSPPSPPTGHVADDLELSPPASPGLAGLSHALSPESPGSATCLPGWAAVTAVTAVPEQPADPPTPGEEAAAAPGGADPPPPSPPPRRRGRPPKTTHETELGSDVGPVQRTPKKRGRPRKSLPSGEAELSGQSSDQPAVIGDLMAAAASTPKKRGRPRKTLPSGELSGKESGQSELCVQSSDQPAVVGEPTAVTAKTAKKRGRPRKIVQSDALSGSKVTARKAAVSVKGSGKISTKRLPKVYVKLSGKPFKKQLDKVSGKPTAKLGGRPPGKKVEKFNGKLSVKKSLELKTEAKPMLAPRPTGKPVKKVRVKKIEEESVNLSLEQTADLIVEGPAPDSKTTDSPGDRKSSKRPADLSGEQLEKSSGKKSLKLSSRQNAGLGVKCRGKAVKRAESSGRVDGKLNLKDTVDVSFVEPAAVLETATYFAVYGVENMPPKKRARKALSGEAGGKRSWRRGRCGEARRKRSKEQLSGRQGAADVKPSGEPSGAEQPAKLSGKQLEKSSSKKSLKLSSRQNAGLGVKGRGKAVKRAESELCRKQLEKSSGKTSLKLSSRQNAGLGKAVKRAESSGRVDGKLNVKDTVNVTFVGPAAVLEPATYFGVYGVENMPPKKRAWKALSGEAGGKRSWKRGRCGEARSKRSKELLSGKQGAVDVKPSGVPSGQEQPAELSAPAVASGPVSGAISGPRSGSRSGLKAGVRSGPRSRARWTCSECGARFALDRSLKVHLRTHLRHQQSQGDG